MTDILQIERDLLFGRRSPATDETSRNTSSDVLAQQAVDGKFKEILTGTSGQRVLATYQSFKSSNIPNRIPPQSSQNTTPSERLIVAIALLHTFLQSNWTGPDVEFVAVDILPPKDTAGSTEDREKLLNASSIESLSQYGEPAYHLTHHATLLVVALWILDTLAPLPTLSESDSPKSALWWRLRAHSIHQQILDEPCPNDDLLALSAAVASSYSASNDPELQALLHLELGLFHHSALCQDRKAGDLFRQAAEKSGMVYEVTGILGKKTKFQQTDTSQLVVLAKSKLRLDGDEEEEQVTEQKDAENVPETLKLNDDTLLEETAFKDPTKMSKLHPLDQSILLSLCLNIKNTSPVHGLTQEQMSPYITRVVSQPRNWSIHTMALLLRSRLEAERTRTMDRSVLQLQALVDQMPTADSTITERLQWFHALAMPSKFVLQKELGTRFLSMGVVRSAMEIFERLEMWEDYTRCLVSLDKTDQAKKVIQDLLAGGKVESEWVIESGKTYRAEERQAALGKKREAKLLCLLADLSEDHAESIEIYEKAWELSGKTSARAMRSLGGLQFAQGEFSKAVEALKEAVRISPLTHKTWFILGCAAVRIEDWEEARQAFGRCVSLDDEDGESWNNLASVWVRIGEKQDDKVDALQSRSLAHRALRQGLKFSYSNWRMWTNYMLISVDIGEYAEAARAMTRIVQERTSKGETGDEVVDVQVLERLVDVVVRAAANTGEETSTAASASLHRSISTLFDKTILPSFSTPRIFRAYARLLIFEGKTEEGLKAYLDAYRFSTSALSSASAGDPQDELDKWKDQTQETLDILGILENYTPEEKNWKLKAKSILRTFMARNRDKWEDATSGNGKEEWVSLEKAMDELS